MERYYIFSFQLKNEISSVLATATKTSRTHIIKKERIILVIIHMDIPECPEGGGMLCLQSVFQHCDRWYLINMRRTKESLLKLCKVKKATNRELNILHPWLAIICHSQVSISKNYTQENFGTSPMEDICFLWIQFVFDVILFVLHSVSYCIEPCYSGYLYVIWPLCVQAHEPGLSCTEIERAKCTSMGKETNGY